MLCLNLLQLFCMSYLPAMGKVIKGDMVVQLSTPSGRLESQSDKVPWASMTSLFICKCEDYIYFLGLNMYIYIYKSHTGFRAYMSILSLYAKRLQHQTSNEYESIKTSIKTHIWKTDINIHRSRKYKRKNKKKKKTKKNTFVYVCLFVSGGHKVPKHFDNISRGLFRSLRTSIRIRSSKSEASEANNSELSMPSWKGGECFDLVGGWGGVQSEFRTQQKLTENRKTYYSIKPKKTLQELQFVFQNMF